MTPPPTRRSGCARHLPILVGLLGVALAILVARHPDALRRLVADQRAMRAGSDVARTLDTPEALLDWIAAHPEHASLVVLDADGAPLLAHAPGTERAVAGLPALWLVAEWADRAASGRLDTTAVSPEHLAARRLPGTGADTAALPSGALTPDRLVRRMLDGDRAAESALLDRLGPAAVARRAARHGAEPPAPFEGLLLAWQSGDTAATRADVLARRLAADADFRAEAARRFREGGLRLSLDEQRAAAAASLPRGTATAYARLLHDALRDSLGAPGASARFLDALAPTEAVGALRFGSRGGGLPGHLALAAYAEAPTGDAHRVAVLILDGLPIGLFYHLARTGLDAALVLRLLTDDASLTASIPDRKCAVPARTMCGLETASTAKPLRRPLARRAGLSRAGSARSRRARAEGARGEHPMSEPAGRV